MNEDFQAVSSRLAADMQIVRQRANEHPGELGAGIEHILRDFLKTYLPNNYSVGSGFIRDTNGRRSDQMDVVINDDAIFAPFPYEETRHLYLVESVAAVVQVKTTLDSTQLKDALDNLNSAMQLRKKRRGELAVRTEWGKATSDLVRSYVFAFGSGTSLKTLRDTFRQFYDAREIEEREEASMVGVLDKGHIVNYPPGYDLGAMMIDGEPKLGTFGVEAEKDTLFYFLSSLLLELPRVVFARPVLSDYFTHQPYTVHEGD